MNPIFPAATSSYYVYSCALGPITIGQSRNAIVWVRFGIHPLPDIPKARSAVTDRAAKQIEEYLRGERQRFTLPLDPQGTPFQKAVWKALTLIPYGMQYSYSDVADQIKKPRAVRAVGMANNRNPIAVLIPCHRVVGIDGSLVGYAGGLEVKEALLKLEQTGQTVSIKPKICVIGSMNMDMVTTAERIPNMGETMIGQGFHTYCGGKGANQATAASRLGGRVSMVGAVGDDAFGHQLIKQMEENDIDMERVMPIPDVITGVATILVCQGDHFIILESGANGAVDRAYVDTHMGHILDANQVLLQNEIPMDAVAYLLHQVSGQVPIVYNPAPSREETKSVLPYVDILVVNEHECGDILGIVPQTPDEAKECAKMLKEMGPKGVVITMGSQGAVWAEDDMQGVIPALRVDAVDSTAAGDCFCGALAVKTAEGYNLPSAAAWASTASGLAVTRKGAQSSIPTRQEVDERHKHRRIAGVRK